MQQLGLRGVFRVPEPDAKVEGWHVSPLIDLAAYSLSWVWVLVPLLLLGPARADYLFWYLLTIGLTDLHRHFGLPYVYLDSQVRARYPARFWLFPAVLLLAWAASPYLAHSELVLSPVGACALAGLVVLLVQILRRDGGEAGVPVGELTTVLGGALSAALLLDVCTRSLRIDFDGAWWWFGAALFASTWFDSQRIRRSAQAPATPPTEQAIASLGGPRFAASMLILALMGLALVIRPWLERHQVQPGVPIDQLIAIVGVLAALWNFWHVYMQKYGIMRLYNAKARGLAQDQQEVPGWIDRALVLCWLPLYFAYLGPLYREIAVDYFDDAAAVLPGFIDLLEQAMPVSLPVTIAFVVVIHVLWLRAEFRVNRLRSAPRLLMAGGTTGLALCFFVFDPVKVYLAFAFSHALEYCVFVWAYQRKRYQSALAHGPVLGHMLRRPLWFYLGMILAFGVALLLLKYWGRWIMPDADRPELFGYRTAYWLGFWGVYQSLVHFYFDGFLWKMRLPSVRANI
ncbi:hypothetical protein DB30_00179 [Enhygromyxa salina]|uniref:Uncharacterized protein n=1 Tax=Enhygromyxa salina TaxID=215803 RepID=A0A0C1ZLV0_9BACT|nr:hypothetical protein [Enhygromyxa salina]KIG18494.1 hypothetical protein DB30_00179 [Enhygromyxa salina]